MYHYATFVLCTIVFASLAGCGGNDKVVMPTNKAEIKANPKLD
jgi:hypothetical protein